MIYLFLANGFEEIEALATVDIIKRAGLKITTVGVGGREIIGSHNIPVKADICENELDFNDIDMVIFPGGMPGAKNLAEFGPLMALLKAHWAAGGGVAAICASPAVVLASLGDTFAGLEMTCYDGFEATLQAAGIKHKEAGSVVDGRLVTGRGPGYATEFALSILAQIKDRDTAAAVSAGFTPR